MPILKTKSKKITKPQASEPTPIAKESLESSVVVDGQTYVIDGENVYKNGVQVTIKSRIAGIKAALA